MWVIISNNVGFVVFVCQDNLVYNEVFLVCSFPAHVTPGFYLMPGVFAVKKGKQRAWLT
jgi:hypothetical protein